MKNRAARIVFAVIFLIGFGIYTYKQEQIHWHSDDIESWGEATGLHPEGYNDIVDMNAAPQEPEPAEIAAEPEAPAEPVETAEPSPEPEEDNGLPKVDIDSWELLLVNSDNLLDKNYAPPTVINVSDSQCPVDSRIADALQSFADAVSAQGLPVFLSSGYRSYDEQNYLYNRKLSQGYTPEQASKIVALPGSSEHQTGLCCDITDHYRETKSWEELEPTETYQWMAEHCQEYGFIVRYPKNKSGLNTDEAATSVTGIIYEPWHFRYVGVEAATYIMENDLCLEEFIALYK